MKRTLLGTALSIPLLLGITQAHAIVISHNLNEVINGGSSLSASSSFGTVTFADDAINSNKVDVTINLNGAGWKVQGFDFNYNDAKFGNNTSFVMTGDVSSYSIDENGTKAGGYTAGYFDVQAPKNGNIGYAPVHFTIALAGTDLDPSDFDFKDTSSKLFDAVHIGNCGSQTCTPTSGTGEASIWVGAGDPTPVPEPASLALLGIGTLGLGFIRRKAK